MTRRHFIAVSVGFAAALPARADSASEVWDVIAAMAAALAEDNAPGFLKPIDLRTPGYDLLAQDVTGLLLQAEAESGILPVRNEGDDYSRTVEVNWELRLRRKGNDLRTQNRRQTVTLRFNREGKRWKVMHLDPISFFAPPSFR